MNTDKKFERPEELHYLRGDATKAKKEMGWEPTITFEDMMAEMVDHWLDKLQNPKLEFDII